MSTIVGASARAQKTLLEYAFLAKFYAKDFREKKIPSEKMKWKNIQKKAIQTWVFTDPTWLLIDWKIIHKF